MTIKNQSQNILNTLGQNTQKLESKASELWTNYSPYYTNLEPWQRGTLLIALTLFLLFAVYYLTKAPSNPDKKKEKQIEEKILRQMALFRKLQQ